MIGLGNGWEMADTETTLIWNVSEQDFKQLTVGPLLRHWRQMVRWRMVRQGGHFLL